MKNFFLAVFLGVVFSGCAFAGVVRNLPDSASPGQMITVYLDVDFGQARFGVVTEELPAGFKAINVSHGGKIIEENTTKIAWIWITKPQDRLQLEYRVVVPNETGMYSFGGIYSFENMTTIASISGDNTITIERSEQFPLIVVALVIIICIIACLWRLKK
jgi:hypothetical protein